MKIINKTSLQKIMYKYEEAIINIIINSSNDSGAINHLQAEEQISKLWFNHFLPSFPHLDPWQINEVWKIFDEKINYLDSFINKRPNIATA